MTRRLPISVDVTAIRQTRWYEEAIRFLLGGLITMITGLVARRYGPSIAGLFLAFPAIFPAAATLVAKHEMERKQRQGMPGIARGKDAAALDARGAVMGSLALFAFAAIVWRWLPAHGPALVLLAATLAWAVCAGLIWWMHRRWRPARIQARLRSARG